MSATIGENIRRALREKGVTQRELAKLTGMTEQTVSRWCGDKRTPAADDLKKIANVLNVSADLLLGLSVWPLPRVENCPFCGSGNINYFASSGDENGKNKACFVICKSCRASLRAPVLPGEPEDARLESAVEAWNRMGKE